MISSFKYLRYNFLDNIEMFVSENEVTYFPFHKHDYFCISLITKGTEQLQTKNSTYYATTGSISITQANEAHKNSSVNNFGYSYQTIYINPDLLRYYNHGKPVTYLERIIENSEIANLISNLFKNDKNTLLHTELFINKLIQHARTEDFEKVYSFDLIDDLIAETGINRLSLDQMASNFCMSKYHFIRKFKDARGLTPQAYVTLQRLENAKKMLLSGEEIKSVAFLNGFYDTTHLNTAFKRYFGVSSFDIKNSNIIHFDKDF